MTHDPTLAVRWLDQRLAHSNLLKLYFDLRQEGLDAAMGADAVGALAHAYSLGRCAFLATVAARRVGRDRLVGFHWPDGRLIHAVVACTPQYEGEPLVGDCVDVLGRSSLRTMQKDLSECVAPVTVSIGDLAEDEHFLPGEQAALVEISAQLPWLRRTLLLPEPDEAGPAAFLAAARWAEHVTIVMGEPSHGAGPVGDAVRPPS